MKIIFLFVLLNIPSIYSSIQPIKVRENLNVTITCDFNKVKSRLMTNSLSSISTLNTPLVNNLTDNIILWYKDDTQVIGVNSIPRDANKYYIDQLNTHTYQLTVLNVGLESSGLYKCQNFTAKEEISFQLNVIGMLKSLSFYIIHTHNKEITIEVHVHLVAFISSLRNQSKHLLLGIIHLLRINEQDIHHH